MTSDEAGPSPRDLGGRRTFGKKSDLAEEVTRPKGVHFAATPPNHSLAFEQDEKLSTRFVLTDELFPGREVKLVRYAGDLREIALRHPPEERDVLQRLQLAVLPSASQRQGSYVIAGRSSSSVWGPDKRQGSGMSPEPTAQVRRRAIATTPRPTASRATTPASTSAKTTPGAPPSRSPCART